MLHSRAYSLASGGTLTISIEGDCDPFLLVGMNPDSRLIEGIVKLLDDYEVEFFPQEAEER